MIVTVHIQVHVELSQVDLVPHTHVTPRPSLTAGECNEVEPVLWMNNDADVEDEALLLAGCR